MNAKQRKVLEILARRAKEERRARASLDAAALKAFDLGLSSRQVAAAIGLDNASVWRRYVRGR